MSGRDLVRGARSLEAPAYKQVQRNGLVDLLIGAVAVVAVGAFAYFGYGAWFAPRTPPPPPAAKVELASVAPADAWTDKDTARCNAAARAAADAPLPSEMMLANTTIAEGFAAMATRLECRITTKIARFCDPREKAALVATIDDYLGRVDVIRLGLGVEGAPMAVLGGAFGGEIAAGSEMYNMEKDATFTLMDFYHAKVAAGLKALGRRGIVAASDFGGFMGMGVPLTISEIFKGVSADHPICA